MRAPERDARVVAEQVDHLARLAHRLLAGAARVAPLQREVLPEQEAGRVGRVVELGPGHVRVDAEQVEVGVDRELHVAGQLRGRSPRRAPCGSALVRAHREDALAVDRPAASRARGRRGTRCASRRSSLGTPVDLDPHLDVALRLLAEPPRPPARRVVDLDGERCSVLSPAGEHHVAGRRSASARAVGSGHGRVRARAERHRVRVRAGVERDVEQEPAARLGRLACTAPAAT